MTKHISKNMSTKRRIWGYRLPFTLCATATAFVLYTVLFGFGLVPDTLTYQPHAQAQETATKEATAQSEAVSVSNQDRVQTMPTQEQPTRLSINKIGVDTKVLNPATTDPQALDNYLNRAAVRYPESGLPGSGNVFIFGHSTSHDTVWNQAYKTFNRLEELTGGDNVNLKTASGTFTYRVQSVQTKENSRAFVPFDSKSNRLTIVTCDSFGAKEDRIIVRAELAEFQPH
jgi:LPXTG-site transpeptidase (sortase) family protein